jgi:hypothetical protein
MTPPDRFRALLAEPGFIAMPAVWDGLSAKLAGQAVSKPHSCPAPAWPVRDSAVRTST